MTQKVALKRKRSGAAVVEFAVVVPLLFLIVFALIEYARMAMVSQTLTHAAQEGCRRGIVPGSTTYDVQTVVE